MAVSEYNSISAREFVYLAQVKHLIEEADRAVNSLVELLRTPPPWTAEQKTLALQMAAILTASDEFICSTFKAPSLQFAAYHRKMQELLASFREFGDRASTGIVRHSVEELQLARTAALEFAEIAAYSMALLSEIGSVSTSVDRAA